MDYKSWKYTRKGDDKYRLSILLSYAEKAEGNLTRLFGNKVLCVKMGIKIFKLSYREFE